MPEGAVLSPTDSLESVYTPPARPEVPQDLESIYAPPSAPMPPPDVAPEEDFRQYYEPPDAQMTPATNAAATASVEVPPINIRQEEISPTPYNEGMLNWMRRSSEEFLAPGQESGANLISPETADLVAERMGLPAKVVAQGMEKLTGLPYTKAEKGFEEAVSEALHGFTSLEGIAGLANPFMLEAFAVNTITNLPDQFGRIKEAVQKHGFISKESAKAFGEAGIADAFGFLALRGGVAKQRKLYKKIAPKPGGIIADEATGKALADQFGLSFKGVQKTPEGLPDFLMFEDPVAGGTIAKAGDSIADFGTHLEQKRATFKGGEISATEKGKIEEGVRPEPEDRVEGREAKEAGPGDRIQPAAEVRPQEVAPSKPEQLGEKAPSESGIAAPAVEPELFIEFGGQRYAVDSIADASAKFSRARDEAIETPSESGIAAPAVEPTVIHSKMGAPKPVGDLVKFLDSKFPRIMGKIKAFRVVDPAEMPVSRFGGHVPAAIKINADGTVEVMVNEAKISSPLALAEDVGHELAHVTEYRKTRPQSEEQLRSVNDVQGADFETYQNDPSEIRARKIGTEIRDRYWEHLKEREATAAQPDIGRAGEAGPPVAPAVEPAVPEQFKPKSDVRQLLEEQKAPPEMLKAPGGAMEGGALGFGGGKRAAKVAPIGKTPLGDKYFLRIEAPSKRLGHGLMLEGGRHSLARTKNKVGQMLAKATRQHVDLEQELYGIHEKMVRDPQAKIGNQQRIDGAWGELSNYVREKEAGRPVPKLQPDAQALLNGVNEMFSKTGDIALANNVHVREADGSFRPMRKIPEVIPRMFSRKFEDAIADPQKHAADFNQFADDLAKHRGITPEEAATELRDNIGARFTRNDHMSNLEMARNERGPESFYEHDLRNLVARYLPSFSERMAQIISFGQRLGEGKNPQQPNLWDIARREAGGHDETTSFLTAAEDQATNVKPRTPGVRFTRRAQAVGNAALLSDPTTTVLRNLLSGIGVTTERYGFTRSLRELHKAARHATQMDARQIGVMRDDVGGLLGAEELGSNKLDNWIRDVQSTALKVSGFSGSEGVVRGHNMLVASTFARDAAASLVKNPKSFRSKEALAYFKRFDVDAEKIVAEKGDWRTGPETRKYIRTAVRESQGGYRYDQVPLWAGTPAGRFLYTYGRWGIQRAGDIVRNSWKDFVGENVEFRGQQMRHWNPFPMMRLGLITAGLGETFAALSSALFNKDRKDSTFKEIGEAFKEDELRAVGMLGERIVNDIITAGTLGILSQPFDFFKSLKDQTRFKNPAQPPALFGVTALIQLGQKFIDQGGSITRKDIMDFAGAVVRGPKNVLDVAAAKYGDIAAKTGLPLERTGEQFQRSQNDQRTLRNAARRWAKEQNMDVSPPPLGDFRKGKNAPVFEAVNRQLMAGDAQGARAIADKFINSSGDPKKAIKAIHGSVTQRHPFRAGQFASDVHQKAFIKWAQEHLPEQDFEQVTRVIKIYEETAKQAGFTR